MNECYPVKVLRRSEDQETSESNFPELEFDELPIEVGEHRDVMIGEEQPLFRDLIRILVE